MSSHSMLVLLLGSLDGSMLWQFLFFSVLLVPPIWVYRDAHKTGRNEWFWAIITFCSGPLFAVVLLIYVIIGPPRENWRRVVE